MKMQLGSEGENKKKNGERERERIMELLKKGGGDRVRSLDRTIKTRVKTRNAE